MPKKRQTESTEHLTNEALCKKFPSHFEIVNHAIALAENFIYSGRAPRVTSDESQGVPSIILREIMEGKDFFEEISPADEANESRSAGRQE